jgi:anti-sigma B factor antagonist
MATSPVEFPFALEVECVIADGGALVRCSGRLTIETAPRLKDEIKRLLPECRVITLDLTDLSYIDSAGLGVLVGAYVSTRKADCQLRLINLNQRVKDLLGLARLTSIFEGYGQYL